LFLYWLVCLGPKFQDNESKLSLNESPRNLRCKSRGEVWCGIKPENLPAKLFTIHVKIWRGKPSNFADLSPICRQSTARNFETAQHIDKQKLDVSSTINALKTMTNLGHHPHGILMQPRKKIDKL